DRASRKSVSARDRMGEKPSYYGYSGAESVFASELKGSMPIPGFGRNSNRNALASFMRHNYIPAPQSIYEGIAKSPPGTWIEFTADDTRSRRMPEPRVYWSARDAADTAAQSSSSFDSDAQATDALEGVSSKAVGGQMSSDVS
ncbi:hypothetical protein OY671_013130, partial [Metschnikowia pulcherrima]